MSRCFPFPPPGYEKKARPEQDANFIIKEDQKDKKHKKDKKDKEKKERKEKEKEKSSDKEREKKEKKHKHKDKKEKKREKEGRKSSEERKSVGFLDHQKSELVSQTGVQFGETRNSRPLVDFGKKVRNENGVKETQIIERTPVSDLSMQSSGKAPEISNALVKNIPKFKNKKEENRIPNGHHLSAAGLANGFVSHFPAKKQKNVDGVALQEAKVTEKPKEHKDTNKQKNDVGKGDKLKDSDREKKSKSKDKKRKREKEKEKKVNELPSLTPSKVRDGGNNAVDCSNDKGLTVSSESSSSRGILDKRKKPEKDGILNGNEVQSNKLLRPTFGSHQVFPTGNRTDMSNAGIQFPLEEGIGLRHKSNSQSSSSSPVIENRMKLEMRLSTINIVPEKQEMVNNQSKASNGTFTHVKPGFGNGRSIEPSETVRISASVEPRVVANPALGKKAVPLHPVENGRKSQSGPANGLPAVYRQGIVTKLKFSDKELNVNGLLAPRLDEKALKINGLVELKKQSTGAKISEKPTSSGQQRDILEMPVKPPHPDVKYLDKILSIPKVEWSDVDDQTWLFSHKNQPETKSGKVSMMTEKPKQVWAEAMHIESADVTALPYVIPY